MRLIRECFNQSCINTCSSSITHCNCPDDERKVGWDAEWVVECDLGQITSQHGEVDVLGTTALESLVKDLQMQQNKGSERGACSVRE